MDDVANLKEELLWVKQNFLLNQQLSGINCQQTYNCAKTCHDFKCKVINTQLFLNEELASALNTDMKNGYKDLAAFVINGTVSSCRRWTAPEGGIETVVQSVRTVIVYRLRGLERRKSGAEMVLGNELSRQENSKA